MRAHACAHARVHGCVLAHLLPSTALYSQSVSEGVICFQGSAAHLVRVAREEAVLVEQVVDHARKHLLLMLVLAGLEGLEQLHHLRTAQQQQLPVTPLHKAARLH